MKKSAPDYGFLTWLIGFTEGDGSFVMSKSGSFVFGVYQHKKNIEVLNMIKNRLGFGKIRVQHNMANYIIETQKELYLIGLLFNGNLVTVNKKLSFDKWLLGINKRFIKGRSLLPAIESGSANILPSLNDSWISGFVDAEGCFSVSIRNKTKGFNIIFDIAQNNFSQIGKSDLVQEPVLRYLEKLFSVGKAYQSNSRPKASGYRVSGLKATATLMPYFDKHPLLTDKYISYMLWKELHLRFLNKEHLDPILRDNLKILARKVNQLIEW